MSVAHAYDSNQKNNEIPSKFNSWKQLTKVRRHLGLNVKVSIQRPYTAAGRDAVLRFLSANRTRKSYKNPLTLFKKQQRTLTSYDSPRYRPDDSLYLPGIGIICLKTPLPAGDMRSFTLVDTTKKHSRFTKPYQRTYKLHIQIAVPTAVRGLPVNPVIRGVDVGIVHPATVMELPSKSSEFHDSSQDARRHKGDQIDKLKTKRSKKRKLSRTYKDISRRINRKYRKIMNRQDNFERETASKITKGADMVALETLNLKAMTKRGGSHKKGLNREMHYSRINALVTRIKNSCEKHGIKLVDINARYTSQTCSLCGRTDRKSRITQSRFECTTCNYKTNADINAAYNIAAKAAGMVVYRRKNGDGLNPSTIEGSSDEKPFDFFRAPRKDMRDDYSCI